MTTSFSDSSGNMHDMDRRALLTEAADQLDLLRRGHLGTDQAGGQTPEGNFVRALRDDEARFAALPTVYKITSELFQTRNLEMPIALQALFETHNFYQLEFPVFLVPRANWGFNFLEADIEFNPDDQTPHTRPKAYHILPEMKFQDLLKAESSAEFGLDENLEFSARTGALEAKVGTAESKLDAGAGVQVKGGFNFVVGPFKYSVKRARIYHTAVGVERVFWRLDGVEFFQDDNMRLFVIAQVPKETHGVKIVGRLLVKRYFNFASATLQQAIGNLPKALQAIFHDGLPLVDDSKLTQPWDITPLL